MHKRARIKAENYRHIKEKARLAIKYQANHPIVYTNYHYQTRKLGKSIVKYIRKNDKKLFNEIMALRLSFLKQPDVDIN